MNKIKYEMCINFKFGIIQHVLNSLLLSIFSKVESASLHWKTVEGM